MRMPRRSSRQSSRLVRRSQRSLQPIEKLEDRLAMAVFAVTSISDSGSGSLRDAILQANALAGADRIEFNLTDPSKTIALNSALPFLTGPTEIDGSSQTDFVDLPIVELDGSAITDANISGLTIASDNCMVRGLAISNFSYGISLLNASGAVIAGNHIGVDSSGNLPLGNRSNGIYVIDSSDNLIGGSTNLDRNVISGNTEEGIRITGDSTGNRIQGNYIGTDAQGLNAIPNNRNGILIGDGANQNIIGTDGDGKDDDTEGNIIAGNGQSGIFFSGTRSNRVAGNRIGIGAGTHTPLANGSDGISIAFQSSANVIGTNADGVSDDFEANVIASNRDNGIRINDSRANDVAGNFIGVLSDGVTGSPNVRAGILMDGNAQLNFIGRVLTTDVVGGNVISANGTYGVWIDGSSNNSVNGNVIGLTAAGDALLANTLAAVRLSNSANNAIGVTDGLANAIGYDSVAVQVEGSSPTNIIINSYSSSDSDGMPIDLGSDGLTPNDAGDSDTGPNALQNTPVIEMVTNRGEIAGTLNSRPLRTYRIHLYLVGLAPDGVTKEHELLRSFSVETDSQGNADWLVNTFQSLSIDDSIAATAYELSSGTSELSAETQVVASRQLSLASNSVSEAAGSVQGTVFRAASDVDGEVIVELRSSDVTRATVPAQVVIPADSDRVEFTINILDDQMVHYDQLIISALAQGAGSSVALTITDNDNPWHNFRGALDVNGDGSLSAIDALLIINELNSNRAGSLAGRTNGFPPIFIDVNNDGNVTASDALLVINAINTGGTINGEGAGEGESQPEGEGESVGADFSEWERRRKLG